MGGLGCLGFRGIYERDLVGGEFKAKGELRMGDKKW